MRHIRSFIATIILIALAVPSLAAVQWSTAVRNARLDAIETTIGASPIFRIYDGTIPADCAAAITGNTLAEITLGANWAGDASGGVKAWSGMPISDASANNTGVATHWRLLTSGGVCSAQGTVTATGEGGDLTLDNTTITQSEPFTITSWSWTEGGP